MRYISRLVDPHVKSRRKNAEKSLFVLLIRERLFNIKPVKRHKGTPPIING
jgi:hypothetical protein